MNASRRRFIKAAATGAIAAPFVAARLADKTPEYECTIKAIPSRRLYLSTKDIEKQLLALKRYRAKEKPTQPGDQIEAFHFTEGQKVTTVYQVQPDWCHDHSSKIHFDDWSELEVPRTQQI